jgi:hypothetical protein
MRGNVHVRFGGRRMEKGAVGCPSLPMHHGRTNSDVSRNLASRLPYSPWATEACSNSQPTANGDRS